MTNSDASAVCASEEPEDIPEIAEIDENLLLEADAEPEPDPGPASAADQIKARLDEEPGLLTPRERKVIALRLGFADGQPRTLEAVARELNLTEERVRQIEGKLLRKLHFYPRRKYKLRDFLH